MEDLAEPRSQVQQIEKINSTQSRCKFLYCGGTCGRPACEERAFDVDLLPSPPPNVDDYFYVNLERCGGSLYVDLFRNIPKVDNGLGATTGMPRLRAPAELEAESKVDLERCGESRSVDLPKSSPKVDNGFGATTGMPHLPAPHQLEAASESESVDSNCFTDPEPPRIIELSSDSESPRRTYKSLRINADPPSPSRKNATRQRAPRSTIGRCVRLSKKRSPNVHTS